MSLLPKVLAGHPLPKKPYNAIKFVRTNGAGIPLYTVGRDKREFGAASALKTAFELYGGHCFHCKTWMPPQPLSHDCTRDHLRPRKDGGGNYLHNLVFACRACNRTKGGSDLITFRAEVGVEYMKVLDAHLVKCLQILKF